MDDERRIIAGRYRLGEQLGQGGMGVVWQARDLQLDRDVAVKELRIPAELTEEEQTDLRGRVLREARAAVRIRHPNVVDVHDVVEEDQRPWIVMELVPGKALADDLAEGYLPVREAARLGLQILDGLTAVHTAGVVHRDVKPANVLITPDGRAVLTDFGIATLAGSTTLTATGMMVGTLEYMAPERAQGVRPAPASDLWSLGVTLYQMTEGYSPFRRTGHMATLHAVVGGEFDTPRRAGALTPAIRALLAKDPEQRATAAGVRPMLVAACREEPTVVVPLLQAPPPQPAAEQPPARPSYSPQFVPQPIPQFIPTAPAPAPAPTQPRGSVLPLVISAGALALAVVVIATLLLINNNKKDDDPAQNVADRTSSSAPFENKETGTPTPPQQSPSVPTVTVAPQPPPGQVPAPATTVTATATVTAAPPTQQLPPATNQSGYVTVADPGGFSVSVPAGWTNRVVDRGRVQFQSSGNIYRLSVNVVPTTGDPYTELQSDSGNYPGYDEISMTRTTYRGNSAAKREFTWTDNGSRRRSVNFSFVRGGTSYTFVVSGPESDLSTIRAAYDQAYATFTPR